MNAIHRRLSRHLLLLLLLPLALAPPASAGTFHTLDTTQDGRIDLDELLRGIQFYNSLEYHCAAGTEDGFAAGPGDNSCTYHDLDYAPADWSISIDELLRGIQFYNLPGIARSAETEDGFESGVTPFNDPRLALEVFNSLDSNRDRSLTREEAAKEFSDQESFDTLDTNADNQLSRIEFLPHSQGQLSPPLDSGPPTISLNAPEAITLNCGDRYIPPSVTAFDPDEGDITEFIQVLGHFDTADLLQTREVVFSITDRACNTDSATQRIHVKETDAPTLTLLGASPYSLNCGYTFNDPGATAISQCTGSRVPVEVDLSELNATEPGDYVVRYTARSLEGEFTARAERIVHVMDTRKPIISLSGESPLVLAQGSTWVEPGYSADDICDGELPVTISEAPDTSLPGTYSILYSATDSSGNTMSRTRTVIVFASDHPLQALEFNSNSGRVYVRTDPKPVVTTNEKRYFYKHTNVKISLDCSYSDYYGHCSYGCDFDYVCSIDVYIDGARVTSTDCSYTSDLLFDSDRLVELNVIISPDCDDTEKNLNSVSAEDESIFSHRSAGDKAPKGAANNDFQTTLESPLATLPTEVDLNSFFSARQKILIQELPEPDSVAPEDFLNHFGAPFSFPTGDAPVGCAATLLNCPWAPGHFLLNIGVGAPEYTEASIPASSLVFAIQKMPKDLMAAVEAALHRLHEEFLTPSDSIAIVWGHGVLLEMQKCTEENADTISNAIDLLSNGYQSTSLEVKAMFSQLDSPQAHDLKRAIIVANALQEPSTDHRNTISSRTLEGIITSVVSVQPSAVSLEGLETYATLGKGRFVRADTSGEIFRALARESRSKHTVVTSKLSASVEFNPLLVSKYRRIGGATEQSNGATESFLPAESFHQGQSFTALYELIPTSIVTSPNDTAAIVDIEFWPSDCPHPKTLSVTVPNVLGSNKLVDLQFSAGVAAFALDLSDSPHKASATLDMARQLVIPSLANDPFGVRLELLGLINSTLLPLK